MAKKVTVSLVDDFDPAQTAVETVEFGLDGNNYEIDLSEKNAGKLRGDMEKWVAAGRKVGGRRTRSGGRESGLPLAEIREWAKKNGHKVSSRGRVSAEIVREWRKAQSEPTPASKAAPAKAADKPAFSAAKQ